MLNSKYELFQTFTVSVLMILLEGKCFVLFSGLKSKCVIFCENSEIHLKVSELISILKSFVFI